VVIAAVALAWMAGCARPWLGGIHASLRMQARGGLVVDRVDSDGPAGRAGLRAGESVLAIDGVATSELTADELRDRVRGDVGTWVVLRVRASDGAERDVSVERGP
jgi:C-terminal processing protease CtpA/Prc